MNHKSSYIAAIDGLRAVAVIAVIIFHYYENALPSGFLGVDVFFVISGYVITSYFHNSSFQSSKDLLLTFYSRRIKRLLPALYFCVALTSITFIFVTSRPPADVFTTAALSLIGVSNIHLLLLSQNYFSVDAQLNPFTHTWSLGVEEQFYLIYPAILIFIGWLQFTHLERTKKVFSRLVILTFLSYFIYLVVGEKYESHAFYLMPTRFWEISLGAIVYFAVQFVNLNYIKKFHILIFGLLLGVLLLKNTNHSLNTSLVSFLTAFFLLTVSDPKLIVNRFLSFKPIVYIGKLSYSLYLWHWSVLVIGKWTIGDSEIAKIWLLFLTFLLALFSYHFIENQFRYKTIRVTNRATILTGAAFVSPLMYLLIFYMPQFINSWNTNLSEYFRVEQPYNWVSDVECHGQKQLSKFKDPLRHCLFHERSESKKNVVYLIGDSHAIQYVFMLRKALENTKYILKYINTADNDDFPAAAIEGKSKLKTLEFIQENSRPNDLVLISLHRGEFNWKRDKHVDLNHPIMKFNKKAYNFRKSMLMFFNQLSKKNVKTIFIRDSPLMRVVATASSCALQIKLFNKSLCQIHLKQDLHTRKMQDLAFDNIKSFYNSTIFIWDPMPYIYNGNAKLDVLDKNGDYNMVDWNHITKKKSEDLAPYFYEYLNSYIDN